MKKWCVLFVVILWTFACKKPFSPPASISADGKYLVVEGVVNGNNDSTFIKLSRTKKVDTLRTVYPEDGAQVTVESDANNIYPLIATIPGTYACPPLNLDITHKYRLRIKTADNKEYVSDFVPVKHAPPIDSLGFTAQSSGVQIYVNAHDDAAATHYYRWEYREDWQFHSKYISTYLGYNWPRPVDQQIHDCFAGDQSTDINIASTTKLARDVIYQGPILFIPANSEKIETKYSILVKQYALTNDAYAFWQNLQNNTEKLGSIFDVLPSQAQTNFHCVTDPAELVIGYLSVGNVSTRRIYITAAQLLPTYSPQYPCYCELDTVFVSPNPKIPQELAWTEQYNRSPSSYKLVQAFFPTPDLGFPDKYTYYTNLCVDCTVRGTVKAPAFWK